MIRVLVVEDSPTARRLLTEILNAEPGIEVVGIASDGEAGVAQALALRPDLITMDIRMPRLDGFEATRRIMEECPTRIIVVSASVESDDLPITFNAIQAGALDVIEKPAGFGHEDFEAIRDRLVTTVKLMAEVKVVRRRARRQTGAIALPPALEPRRHGGLSLLAIGSSTGGPAALAALLKGLPADFPLPVVMVQHMSAGFLGGLVTWLQTSCALPIKMAEAGERVVAGQVYFAPEGRHLVLPSQGLLETNLLPPVNHVQPSVTVLFNSVAQSYGAAAAGVLLTGMGEDGAAGLKAMHDQGALTIAQDEATSVVYGMPRAAVELGAVDHILPLDRIAPMLVSMVR